MSDNNKYAKIWARYWGFIFYSSFTSAVLGTVGGIVYDGPDWIRMIFFGIAGTGLVVSVPSSSEHDLWKEVVKRHEDE